MLASFAAVSTLLFILAAGAVGLRLTALAWRTREFAEALLGPGLFLVVGVGYPTIMVGRYLIEEGISAGPLVVAGSLVVMSVGWSLVWMFTRRVFRPDAAWARSLTWGAYLAFVVCAAENTYFSLTVEQPQDMLTPSWGALGIQVNSMALLVWTGFESFRYYGLLKKRLALGLASVVVANRFLLWGMVAVFSLIAMAGPLVCGLMGRDFMADPFVLLSLAIGGLMSAIALYLAFLPPKAYLRKLEAKGQSAA